MTDTEMKRLHPLKILASIISFIKGSFVIIIYLFFLSLIRNRPLPFMGDGRLLYL